MADRIARSNTYDVRFFEVGQLLTLVEGEYDSVQQYGPYEVLKRFSNQQVLGEFVEGFEASPPLKVAHILDLLPWLQEKGYLGEPDVVSLEWDVGDHLKDLAREHGKA